MFFKDVKDFTSLNNAPWLDLIKSIIPFEELTSLDRLYPEYFNSPAGGKKVISYAGEIPTISLKIQELYGVGIHPKVGSKQIPLRIELLSPALRVVQITCDLPQFWQGSYQMVKKEMKSKYPKHNWADNPLSEVATKNSVKSKVVK
jgi:ATP-dependent helicase HrpB